MATMAVFDMNADPTAEGVVVRANPDRREAPFPNIACVTRSIRPVARMPAATRNSPAMVAMSGFENPARTSLGESTPAVANTRSAPNSRKSGLNTSRAISPTVANSTTIVKTASAPVAAGRAQRSRPAT